QQRGHAVVDGQRKQPADLVGEHERLAVLREGDKANGPHTRLPFSSGPTRCWANTLLGQHVWTNVPSGQHVTSRVSIHATRHGTPIFGWMGMRRAEGGLITRAITHVRSLGPA